MEYLNNEVAPEALYWLPGGKTFAMDMDKVEEQLLNKFFGKTKIQSFLRSLSRWLVSHTLHLLPSGLHLDLHLESLFVCRNFKRVFFHSLDKNTFAFCHPLFMKSAPHLEKDMKLVLCPTHFNKEKRCAKKEEASTAQVAAESSSVQVTEITPPPTLSLEQSVLRPASLNVASLATMATETNIEALPLWQTLIASGQQNRLSFGCELQAQQFLPLLTSSHLQGAQVRRSSLQNASSQLSPLLQSVMALQTPHDPAVTSYAIRLLRSALAKQQKEHQRLCVLTQQRVLLDLLTSLDQSNFR
jgi:hypothetical protein